MKTTTEISRRWLVLFAALVGLSACSNANDPGESGLDSAINVETSDATADVRLDPSEPDAEPDSSSDVADSEDRADEDGLADDGEAEVSDTLHNPNSGASRCDGYCLLVPVRGDTGISVGFGGSVALKVALFSLGTHAPVSEEAIEWRVESGTLAGSRLGSSRSTTDSSGRSEIQFVAGDTMTEVTVVASHPRADPVVFTVTVLDLPVGGLEITVLHPTSDIYDVGPIDVRLYSHDELDCDAVTAGLVPEGSLVDTEIADTRTPAVFEDLIAEDGITVVAFGYGALGEVVAQGCINDILVAEGETTEVNLILHLNPMNLVGEYEVTTSLDFSLALLETGAVGEIIVDILDLFEDPGEQLLDYMVDALGLFVSEHVSDAVDIFLSVTRLDRLIGDAVNDLINSSDTLRQFFSIGCDFRRMVTNFRVSSVLQIGKVGEDSEVFGVETWNTIELCAPPEDEDFVVGECDFDPDCDRVEIGIEDDSFGRLVSGWTGRVVDYDTLQIDAHRVELEYGHFMLFVLESYLFPAIVQEPSAVTLEDVWLKIIDCASFGGFVTGSDGEICVIGCLTDDDLSVFCEDSLNAVFPATFERFATQLSFDSHLELSGTCTLGNDDTDLDVELLEAGALTGTITADDDSTPITGTFVGVRRADPSGECEPNRPFCVDFETAAECTSEGAAGTMSSCSPGRCFEGGCVTSGNSTGEACNANNACLGRRCICGADDTANLDSDLCDGDMDSGYCTSSECELNGCDPASEECVDFGLPGVFGNEAFCVLWDGCSERLGECGRVHRGDNFVCRSLPFTNAARDERTWNLGCWVPGPENPDDECSDDDCLAPIGGACGSDSDCVGGLCIREGDMSYCSATCNEGLGCPDYSACVELPESTSTYCLARATEEDCPRLSTNFDIVASPLPEVTGTASIQVCFFRD